ncbi:MAG: methylenetetrahydrofolate reductase [NAD(P)H] [Ruminococcaceae bacterium]|nr:methylenetetrahydrofolate reductase [NAD(P)H] [Oscillospiraceae bacterium]
MRIIDIIKADKPSLSFEVFPPKTSDTFDTIKGAIEDIARLQPSFMSVTYGAGGGTSEFTVSLSKDIKDNFGVTPLAHLTCINSTKDDIRARLVALKDAGIENILALRGDITEQNKDKIKFDYKYASELVDDIKSFGGFCIGGACYPDGHPEALSQIEDIKNLKNKVDAGCEFLTTQMFFDNNVLYNYIYKIREAGITVPIVAGIMPVTNASQIKRSCALSGTQLPPRFKAIIDRYSSNPEAMCQAGIAYATEQIIDLYANGINAVHVYSMNKPHIAAKIQQNISEIIK